MRSLKRKLSEQEKEPVRVAVNIRPLIPAEIECGCTETINVVPGEPEVQLGNKVYRFDHVFKGSCSPSAIYNSCVARLVDSLFEGCDATVIAYGQTGSGKTYTMGINSTGELNKDGIIQNVTESIFAKINEMKDMEFLIRVSFIEILREEVFDLLNLSEGASRDKPTITTKAPVQIEVRSKEEMTSYLLQGSSSRATKSTRMNNQSSRSHAIFTIYMEQKKIVSCMKSKDIDIMQTKFHLVDLAGSECVKRSGVSGERLKEATSINSGLLVLSKVIDALCKKAKGKKVPHIPYRESKLTYLLQDSLGGSSKTVMIACVSPANTNINETLSTLDYAYRARNIQNKAIRNPDPMSSKRQKRESEVEELQLQLKDKDRKIEDMEEKFKDMEEEFKKMEELLTRTCPREEHDNDRKIEDLEEKFKKMEELLTPWEEIQDKDRKIEYLEEKFKKMQELLTRTRPGEEIQDPWSTRISNTEDFITPTPANSTPCSCTRFSSCRTTRCECHTMGRTCGQACKCRPWRCDMKSSNTTTRKRRRDVGASGISQGRGAFSE